MSRNEIDGRMMDGKMVEAGGVGILTPTDNTQLIDFIKREKRQKQHIRPSEVHGGYTETHKTMR
jgi:hypothetical protein